MIGVISLHQEREIVAEFFQLFKTPWQFYKPGRRYNVLIINSSISLELDADLILYYSGCSASLDTKVGLKPIAPESNIVVKYQDMGLPIYGPAVVYASGGVEWLRVNGSDASIATKFDNNGKQIIRCGYDLFAEIGLLLSKGQPVEYALIPSIELHIAILRQFIIEAGLALIEIPPTPWGRNFTACLTHDVDFCGIRRHFLDRTFFGFAYRALIGSMINGLKGRATIKKVVRNWFSVITLPAVFLGIIGDFWVQFRRYTEIERPFPATFFFIPHKFYSGITETGAATGDRAVKYTVEELTRHIRYLTTCGSEIGLHGIDAWIDPDRGRVEKAVVTRAANQPATGVRMHWLYFNDQSPQYLSQAGFLYDSSLGYNASIGFRNGTVQAFALPNTKTLMELPLNIMDTALFYPDRMNLTEPEALDKTNEVISTMLRFGGVLTINWHHRSISPERLWDDFYVFLLESLKQQSVWFATGTQAIEWFRKRRLVEFGKMSQSGGSISVELEHLRKDDRPGLVLRAHHFSEKKSDCFEATANRYTDFEIPNEDGKVELEFTPDNQ